MTVRSIWKGVIKIGSMRVPVKLYAASVDHTVRFHILDQRHRLRVKQHMVDASTGLEIPADEIKKAFEFEAGRFVIITNEELAALDPEPSRDIEIKEFVPPAAISRQLFDRPYYLGPDSDNETYFALVAALKNRMRVGIAHWVMRGKEFHGALREEGNCLMLVTLRNPADVISGHDLSKRSTHSLIQSQLKMARQLIRAMEGEFNIYDYKDEYRDRLMKFIERKAKGRAPTLHALKSKRKTVALDNVLVRSLEKFRKEKKRAA